MLIKLDIQSNFLAESQVLYNFLCFFQIIFFGFYYWQLVPKKYKKSIIYLTSVFLVLMLISYDFKDSSFQNELGILTCFYLLIISFYWYYIKINSFSTQSILLDPAFWITSGQLFWCIFFIFRITPRYFFQETDKNFLNLLNTIFICVVIVEYALFFVSLTVYQKSLRTKSH